MFRHRASKYSQNPAVSKMGRRRKKKEKLPSRNGGKEMIRKGSEGRLNLSYEMLKSHATKDSYSTKGTVITPQLNEKERKKKSR